MERTALIYTRVSTTEQVDKGGSLETQERLCLEYAVNHGFTVNLDEQLFREEGESAKTADRTKLKAMMRYVEKHKGKIEVILAYRIDRISRNVEDYLALKAFFKRHGVRLLSISEPMEDTPTGRFFENVTACGAQWDNEIRAERARNGMEDAVKAGRFVWRAPTGFKNVLLRDKKNIAPEESQAGFIARGFRMIEGGYTATEALTVLDRDGFRQRNGKRVTISLWSKILHNPLCAGRIAAFRAVHQGNFDAIVDVELFERVQAILDGRNGRASKYCKQREDFPLRGLLTCTCGQRLTASWSRGRRGGKYPYYRCAKCKGVNHKRDGVEVTFKELLAKRSMGKDYAAMLQIAIEENMKAALEDTEKKRREAERRILELEGEQGHIVKKNIAGTYNDDMAKRLTQKAEEEIRAMRIELAKLPRATEQTQNVVAFGLQVMCDLGTAWNDFSLLHKQRFQTFLFPEGVHFANGEFGTPKTALILQIKTTLHEGELSLVTPRGVEPRLQA